MPSGLIFEASKFGMRAILTAGWSVEVQNEIMLAMPSELELNTSKGWAGQNIDFLSSMQWLLSFIIVDMNIEDVSAIHFLTRLCNLEITTYCKTALDFTAFPQLVSCSLQWRRKSESLFECKSLRELFINGYLGKSTEPFGKLERLESLSILNSPLSELHGFENLELLRGLRIGRLPKLKSLEGIGCLANLEGLEVRTCRMIDNLLPIANLLNLRYLNISNNGDIKSLMPLKNLSKLRIVLFYETTNIIDGDLRPIFESATISEVSFKDRKHYSHTLEEFRVRSKSIMEL